MRWERTRVRSSNVVAVFTPEEVARALIAMYPERLESAIDKVCTMSINDEALIVREGPR